MAKSMRSRKEIEEKLEQLDIAPHHCITHLLMDKMAARTLEWVLKKREEIEIKIDDA